MISPTLHDALAKPARQALIIWGAFLVSQPLYFYIVRMVAQGRSQPPVPPPFALPALALLSVAMLVGGLAWMRLSFTDAALRKAPATPPQFPLPGELPTRDRHLAALLAYGQTRLIVGWACFESIGVYGVLCVFLGHPPRVAVPFLAVALVALALHRPRLMDLVERADAQLPRH